MYFLPLATFLFATRLVQASPVPDAGDSCPLRQDLFLPTSLINVYSLDQRRDNTTSGSHHLARSEFVRSLDDDELHTSGTLEKRITGDELLAQLVRTIRQNKPDKKCPDFEHDQHWKLGVSTKLAPVYDNAAIALKSLGESVNTYFGAAFYLDSNALKAAKGKELSLRDLKFNSNVEFEASLRPERGLFVGDNSFRHLKGTHPPETTSDVSWAMWEHACKQTGSSRKNLRLIVAHDIREKGMLAMANYFMRNTPKSPKTGIATRSARVGSPQFRAFLNNALSKSWMYLFMDHHNAVGNKVPITVTVQTYIDQEVQKPVVNIWVDVAEYTSKYGEVVDKMLH
jgi:hypothetical protein